ncbi:alpha/beta hydrolase [Nocardia sp. NPDC127526]|uniref:alpha/beta hydrolase n=1 Tax=Nocardia sp. NPDC127526 TaxID=3345393 RepID=UPI0036306A2A
MTAAPVTKSQAYAITPESLAPQAAEWTTLRDTLQLALDQSTRDYEASTAYWIGAAGDRARTATTETVTTARKAVDALTAAATAATTGQSKITTAKQVTTAAIDLTEQQKFKVAEDGTVTAPDARLSLPADATADDITKAQAALDYRAKHFYEPPIKAALAGLGQIIEDTATAIDTAFQSIGDVKTLPAGLPVKLGERSQQVQDIIDGKAELPGDPKTFHDYWATLTQEDKDALWLHDQYLGNRDGMPDLERDHYNRLKLQDELTRAAAAHNEVAQLTAQHPDWAKYTGTSKEADSWLATQSGYSEWKAKWDNAQRRVDRHDDLSKINEVLADKNDPDRLLLHLDSQTGDRVHTAVADGNPDTASHVTTYVPGTGSEPSKMGADMERVDLMTEQAKAGGAPKPVTIAWFGYDAPPGLGDATDQKYADAAAPALDRFQEGLRVTHEGPPSRNTVLGHSYGTTVVGDAASHGRTLDADAVVFVASPGTTVDHATDLSLTGVPDGQEYLHVFATKAENDPVPLYPKVSWSPWTDDYGRDPTDSKFGAQTFTSDPGTRGVLIPALTHSLAFIPTQLIGAGDDYSTDAHSEYWNPQSKSLVNMGYIIAGDLRKVDYE